MPASLIGGGTDDGGHYIAARFNCPREWFNHFAQNADFNRGAYRSIDGTPELSELLLKAWNAEEADKRWAVMEYEIKGTKFDVQFQFPDEIDPNESEMDRRPRALQRRFGDKPVVYPPWPGDEELPE